MVASLHNRREKFVLLGNQAESSDSVGSVSGSGKCFGFWDVFCILGRVFGFWKVFCSVESILSLWATVENR